jgi:uncharacterized membrane protein (UPF0127 family)
MNLNPILRLPGAMATLLLLFIVNDGMAAECHSETGALLQMQQTQVTIENEGLIQRFTVRVADDTTERAAGFQHLCPQVIERTLMLFIFEQDRQAAFHMRNVHAVLDIGFFDAQGRLLQVAQMLPYSDPRAQRYTLANQPFRYALEARGGWFSEHGLKPGSRLIYQ